MRGREVAWRLFAGELNDSSLVLTGEEERSPTFVVTPLGAKVNRVFAVGVITDIENVGSPEEPLWRARMSDPTGTMFISAGQFQPEAAQALSKMPVPGFAAIIGKVRVYSPEEGVMYLSVRPETVKNVTRESRDEWILDSCRGLKQRIEAFSEAMEMTSPSVNELVDLGYNRNLAEGILSAIEHYGNVPVDRYKTMLIDSLKHLVPDEGQDIEEIKEGEPIEYEEEYEEDIEAEPPVMEPEPEAAGDEDSDEELTDEEEKLIKVIDDEDPDSSGIDWDVLAKAAKKGGLKKQDFETAMEGLLEKGIVYEPMLGRIRKI
jgi:RPA family protein